ncbi:MAG: aldehyde dehydrogenase family protein [Paracoccaceae bacterium]|nr:aldehyde dehydrogenase family protein [Paracoccaceae bacterium]
MTLTDRSKSLFINGDWQAANGTELTVVDPKQNAPFATIKGANADDVRQAAQAAAAAFPAWRAISGATRAKYLNAIARGLEKRQDALVALQMQNSGKPRFEAEIDVGDAVATFDYYATLAGGLDAAQDARVDHAGEEHFGLVRHEPVGPVCMMVLSDKF